MINCPYDSDDIEACPPFANRDDVLNVFNEFCDDGKLVYEEIYGLEVDIESNASIKIYPGICRDSTDTLDIDSPNTITINTGIVGINGIDAGALANNTWYYIYIVRDADGLVGGLVSTADPPALPVGYIYYRRVGWGRTNGSANLLLSQMRDNIVIYDEDDGTSVPLIIATAVNLGGGWTNYSFATAVPPGIRRALVWVEMDSGGNAYTIKWRETVNGVSQSLGLLRGLDEVGAAIRISLDANQAAEVLGNAGFDENLSISVQGYFDFRKWMLT